MTVHKREIIVQQSPFQSSQLKVRSERLNLLYEIFNGMRVTTFCQLTNINLKMIMGEETTHQFANCN